MSQHPFTIIPCPDCHARAGDPCAGPVRSVGVHRARWARARAIHRHNRESRWQVTMTARAIHNATATAGPAWATAA